MFDPIKRILVLQRLNGKFIAICLEKYLAAHGNTIKEAEGRLWGVLMTRIKTDERQGISPLSTVNESPEDVFDHFDNGTQIEFGSLFNGIEVRLAKEKE